MNLREMLAIRLKGLKQNHGDLDMAIEALNMINTSDHLAIRRLKKKKLKIKDEIKRIKALESEKDWHGYIESINLNHLM